MNKNLAGVVLAGGKSSRMGENKALLEYNGKSLLDHMISLLKQSGLKNIYVSGNLDGYNCIPDKETHEGPAWAMHDVMERLNDYEGILFAPVDMPLLNNKILQILMKEKRSGYFMGYPLPVFLVKPYYKKRAKSVRELLGKMRVNPIVLLPTYTRCMTNVNTPDEWKKALRA